MHYVENYQNRSLHCIMSHVIPLNLKSGTFSREKVKHRTEKNWNSKNTYIHISSVVAIHWRHVHMLIFRDIRRQYIRSYFCCCCCCRLRKQANISREKVKKRTWNTKTPTSTFPLLWPFIGDMVMRSLSRYIRSNYDITQHINIIFILNLKSFVNTGPEVSSLTVSYLIVCRCIHLPRMP